ncbi:MAG: hypothetical protein II919_07695 [Lachnospiraceae bacterium]|nr:hypothetical protein [Lachnospiraceae bacterium]
MGLLNTVTKKMENSTNSNNANSSNNSNNVNSAGADNHSKAVGSTANGNMNKTNDVGSGNRNMAGANQNQGMTDEKKMLLNLNSKVEDLKVQNMENAKFLRGISRKIETELYQMRELEENRSGEMFDETAILESLERVEKSISDINNNDIAEAIDKINASIQEMGKANPNEQTGSGLTEEIKKINEQIENVKNTLSKLNVEELRNEADRIGEYAGNTQSVSEKLINSADQLAEKVNASVSEASEKLNASANEAAEKLNASANEASEKLNASANEAAEKLNTSANEASEKLNASANEASEKLNVSADQAKNMSEELQSSFLQIREVNQQLNEAADVTNRSSEKLNEAVSRVEGVSVSMDQSAERSLKKTEEAAERITEIVSRVGEHVGKLSEIASQSEEHVSKMSEVASQSEDCVSKMSEIASQTQRNVDELGESAKNVKDFTDQILSSLGKFESLSAQLDEISKSYQKSNEADVSSVLYEIQNVQSTISQIDQSEVLHELRRIKRFLAESKTDSAAAVNALNQSINRLNFSDYENTLEELRKMLKISEEKSDELGKKIDRVASMPTMVKSVLDRVNADNLSRIEEIIADANTKRTENVRKMMNINLWATLLTLAVLIARILGIV